MANTPHLVVIIIIVVIVVVVVVKLGVTTANVNASSQIVHRAARARHHGVNGCQSGSRLGVPKRWQPAATGITSGTKGQQRKR